MSDWKRAESSTCTGEVGMPPEWLGVLAGATLLLVGKHRLPPERQAAREGLRGLPWHGDSWERPQWRSPTSPVFPSGRPLLALRLCPARRVPRCWSRGWGACSCGGVAPRQHTETGTRQEAAEPRQQRQRVCGDLSQKTKTLEESVETRCRRCRRCRFSARPGLRQMNGASPSGQHDGSET
jgi:hypothetical protein